MWIYLRFVTKIISAEISSIFANVYRCAKIYIKTNKTQGTFLEKIFWSEKQRVAARALISPQVSNESSVIVASRTPPIIGMRDKYTWQKKKNLLIIYLLNLFAPILLQDNSGQLTYMGQLICFPSSGGAESLCKSHKTFFPNVFFFQINISMEQLQRSIKYFTPLTTLICLTLVVCFSFMMILERRTTQIGIVALTGKRRKGTELKWEQRPATRPVK